MIERQHILLDTCIVRTILAKEKSLRMKMEDFLSDLRKRENILYISPYSRYELTRNASLKQKKEIKECLSAFRSIPLNEESLEKASKLYTAYAALSETKRIMASISDIDVFIGSLIFTDKKPLLLTADYNDFPRPFFKEKDYLTIEYKKNCGGRAFQCYYFLEADLEMLFAENQESE